MAKTIANFLVGIGLDTKDWDKAGRKVDVDLDSFKSKAGMAGAAIAAAFTAATLAAIDAGKRTDELYRKLDRLSVNKRFGYNLGNVFKDAGGSVEEAVNALQNADRVRMELMKGDASSLTSAGLAQVDVSYLKDTKDAQDFLYKLSDILSNPNLDKLQKQSLQGTFGLSDTGLRILSKGREEIDRLVAGVDKYAENFEKSAQAGREYAEALSKINTQYNAIAERLSIGILPQLTGVLNGVSGFIDRHWEQVGKATDVLSEKSGEAAVIGGGLTVAAVMSAASGIAAKLGLKTAANAAAGGARLGQVGALAGTAYSLYNFTSKDIEDATGLKNVGKYYQSPSETFSKIGRWWDNSVSNSDAAIASPSVQAARKPNLSQLARESDSVPHVIQIDSKMYLDGREIGNYVERHQMQKNYDAYIESQRTEAR